MASKKKPRVRRPYNKPKLTVFGFCPNCDDPIIPKCPHCKKRGGLVLLRGATETVAYYSCKHCEKCCKGLRA